MSRGQQGIGISAAGMYGLMTTGKQMRITSRPKRGKPAHYIELAMEDRAVGHSRAKRTVRNKS
jgi:DNA topoisomerase-6 subunit B